MKLQKSSREQMILQLIVFHVRRRKTKERTQAERETKNRNLETQALKELPKKRLKVSLQAWGFLL